MYEEYLVKIRNNLKSDPSPFFSFVKIKSKLVNVPSTLSCNNGIATSLNEICEMFPDFFDDVYKVDNTTSRESWLDNVTTVVDIGSIVITREQVYDYLRKLKLKKTTGPDMISRIVLRQCALTLTAPLHSLFNKSLSAGVFPSIWKESYVIQIRFSQKCHQLQRSYHPAIDT